MENIERKLTPAEKHYEAQRRASKAYYDRKHPNPRPRGRPKKVSSPEPQPDPTKPELSGQNGFKTVQI